MVLMGRGLRGMSHNMTQEEKKSYIINNWGSSSGTRIAEMLKRYFVEEKVDSYEYVQRLNTNE